MFTKPKNPLALLEYAALMAQGDTSSYSAKKSFKKVPLTKAQKKRRAASKRAAKVRNK